MGQNWTNFQVYAAIFVFEIELYFHILFQLMFSFDNIFWKQFCLFDDNYLSYHCNDYVHRNSLNLQTVS